MVDQQHIFKYQLYGMDIATLESKYTSLQSRCITQCNTIEKNSENPENSAKSSNAYNKQRLLIFIILVMCEGSIGL